MSSRSPRFVPLASRFALVGFVLWFCPEVHATPDVAVVFSSRCSSCHSVGKGDVVGPDLKGVNARHDRAWLHHFIHSSQSVIRSGDPVATSLFKRYGRQVMPDHPLSDLEIDKLLAYIEAGGPGAGEGEVRPASAATAAEVRKGRDLFLGRAQLAGGGPACIHCHAAGAADPQGAGTLAPDLTRTYLKYKVIDRQNPRGLPRFRDLDGDGDLFDDSYLSDTRLRPLPHPEATASLDRYSVVIPPGTRGPVAVTAAVYYQSIEGVVAKKFLGNLADLDADFVLEPCVLGGACDGRTPTVEPAVVEGAPPVPMEVRSSVIDVQGGAVDTTPPTVRTYPAPGAKDVYQDAVIKAFFSEPVLGADAGSFTLTDDSGARVPAFVDQIGDGTWALFPHRVFLAAGKTYRARLAAGICDFHRNCTRQETVWSFTVAAQRGQGSGDTSVPLGFALPSVSASTTSGATPAGPGVQAVTPVGAKGGLIVTFTGPVMNVSDLTLQVAIGDCSAPGAPVPGRLSGDSKGERWAFEPAKPGRPTGGYCLTVTSGVYDLAGRSLQAYRRHVE